VQVQRQDERQQGLLRGCRSNWRSLRVEDAEGVNTAGRQIICQAGYVQYVPSDVKSIPHARNLAEKPPRVRCRCYLLFWT